MNKGEGSDTFNMKDTYDHPLHHINHLSNNSSNALEASS